MCQLPPYHARHSAKAIANTIVGSTRRLARLQVMLWGLKTQEGLFANGRVVAQW